MIDLLGSFFWDPPREAFTIPFIHLEVYWYSILFAIGFLGAYVLIVKEFWLHLLRAKVFVHEHDISDFSLFQQILFQNKDRKNSFSYDLYEKLSDSLKKKLSSLSLHVQDKKEILKAINEALELDHHIHSRPIKPSYFDTHQEYVRAARRYLFEKEFHGAVRSLKKTTYEFVDRLTVYLFFGMLIGARLGHILFYELDYFIAHPLEIFNVRQGGLASHGGALGLLISFYFFWRKAKKTHLISCAHLLDILMLAVAFVAGCIRIGNFMNQEILGTPSNLPWAVTFGHPFDRAIMPCHPVQLYEALFYFAVCGLLFFLLRKYRERIVWGALTGLLFTLIFTFRFFIEFLKVPQEAEPQGFLYPRLWVNF